METRVESSHHVAARDRRDLNAKPAMFHAGLSSKFTKRHVANFHDTTLMAASAAKQRAERKLERQAEALEKHQRKIESEMKKIEEITERLHRQQRREADRLRHRLHYAASRIQSTFREYSQRRRSQRETAAIQLQCVWRRALARTCATRLRQQRDASRADHAAHVVTRSLRVFACRARRRREWAWRSYAATTLQGAARQWLARRLLMRLRLIDAERRRRERAATKLQAQARMFLTRVVYLDVLFLVCRMQAVVRGFLVRKRLRWLLSINLRALVRFQAIVRGDETAPLSPFALAVQQAINHKAPRKQGVSRRPPVRLAPLSVTEAHADPSGEEIDDQSAPEERLRREEDLKRRLHERKALERRRLQAERRQRVEAENEASERKLMEREERHVRLLMKTALRKHQERERRRQEMDQQREEMERALMLREERWMRLSLKAKARGEMAARERRFSSSIRDSQPGSGSEDTDEELRSLPRPQSLTKTTSKTVSALEAVYSRRKPMRKKVSKARATRMNNNDNDKSDNSSHFNTLFKSQWILPSISSSSDFMTVEMVDDDAEFDYGGDFDDVVDETQLTRLLC
ncbi:hypothetical protein P43SY_009620 [Pythium insidiosum]|uniref:Uncharacterized protein n=1 Tax=Pythium insidiosum TaxID=114742 RepID=A0AAD5Q8N4_PYTIN|nr:hypothetical protein P43SY_009620 [Pythium insidiosum]